MGKFKGLVRKLVVFALAVVSVFTLSVSPSFAAELNNSADTVENVSDDAVLRRSSAKLVAYEQAEVYSNGTITVHLDKTIWGGYLKLTASGGQGKLVDVSVITPDGDTYAMGSCPSDGEVSVTRTFMHLPKGDYTFYLDGFDHYYALACIYNS